MARHSIGLAHHLSTFGHKAGIIINEDPKFVYLKVTKAAGTSILRHTLEKNPDQSPFHIKDARNRTEDWLKDSTDEFLASYYFFSVVRNPWDRFLSLASYVNVPLDDLVENFDEHMKNPVIRHHAHRQWICSHLKDGTLFCDRIARTETLQGDMNTVFHDLGLPRWEIPVKNTTEHKPYRDVFSDKARRFVEYYYQLDIELLDYSF